MAAGMTAVSPDGSGHGEGFDDMTGGGTDPLRLCWREGTIEIEGIVQRVEDCIGAPALRRLVVLVERDGPEALARAEGDFVALVSTRTGVHAFKSFTSQYQIYYREADRTVANRLFAFWSDAARWQDDYFARHVLIVPGYQVLSRDTPVEGVFRVLPGELVTVAPDGIARRQLLRRDYRYRLDAGQRREDAAAQILDLLRDAIRTRLAARPQARVCVEISGGLDSSFIACLLGEQTSGIRGVMFSQPRLPSHAVSEGYAREVADRYGIDLVVIPPEDLPAPPFPEAGYSDEPSDFFWFGDVFSRAVARLSEPGSFVFTGFGADQLFLRSPAFLPYLLKHRQFGAFFKALPDASALLSRGRMSLLRQCLLSVMPERAYRRRQQTGRLRGLLDVSDVNMERVLTADVPWLHCGKGLAAYTLERRGNEAALVGTGILCDDWGYFSAPRTVTQAHFAGKGLSDASPFCDLPLLDHLYGEVSALAIHDFGGRYKELLREAQKGVVPESLRNRRNDTFVFNSFQMNYVDASREYFEDLLGDADAAWVDVAGVRHALQELSFGMTTHVTRSALALAGYLQWRRAFLRRHAKTDEAARDGMIHARVPLPSSLS